ncbi:MAG: UDP-N-acetylmuramoylalanine--D-glutamate ligase [Hyphomicrobiaceae bacterium hypho_1]
MIHATVFKGKCVAVVGLGKSGLAACKALTAGGADVFAWDDDYKSRQTAAENNVKIRELKILSWKMFDALLLSPGIALTHPEPHWSVNLAKSADVEIIGDVEVFLRQRTLVRPNATLVVVTGTNGKSTTTALIAHILKVSGHNVQIGGNIGVPILDLAPLTSKDIYVIELSSYHIDLTPTLNSSIGILLNISPDHLDRHGSFDKYIAIKALVPKSTDYAIIGVDDLPTRKIFEIEKGRRSALIGISSRTLQQGIGVSNGIITQYIEKQKLYSTNKSRAIADIKDTVLFRGKHNAQNAVAATAACLRLGLSANQIAMGIHTFIGLPHRLEEIGRVGHIIFINDSKATNAESTAHALATFQSNIYWIVGGRPKDNGIELLRVYFPRIAKAYLIGEASDMFAQTLNGECPISYCQTLNIAVRQASMDAQHTSDGEAIVLLSPACASFDQFRNFEMRGNTFRDIVSTLPGFEIRERYS